MDKALFKAYVRTLVEEEVKKILPELLNEAISEIKQLTESTVNTATQPTIAPKFDRAKMSELLGISYDGETLSAMGRNANIAPSNRVSSTHGPPEIVNAINRDYSQLMKAMKLT